MQLLREIMGSYIARSLNEVVRERLDIPLPDDLKRLADAFARAGKTLYLVGGAVRDAVQGKTPHDYDVSSSASPEEARMIVQSLSGWKALELGEAHGIIKAISPDKGEYEIAMFRKDGPSSDGRRPDYVEQTTIDQDVLRRDLTINALFYDIDAGEVVDYVGGIEDIKNGIVKAVGDAHQRFAEDKLRILRALRFAARIGSEIDPGTAAAIRDDNSLRGVSGERIRDEFIKGLAAAKSVGHFLGLVTEFDMWPQIFPGFRVDVNIAPNIESRDPPVVLAALLAGNDPRVLVKKLVLPLKWHLDEAACTSFLVRLQSLTPETALRLKRGQANSKCVPEQMLEFQGIVGAPRLSVLKAFIDYVPSISPEELMAQGFKGQALGAELEKREAAEFRNLL